MADLQLELEKAIRVIKIEVSSSEQEELHKELNDFLLWLEPMLDLDTGDAAQVLFRHDAVNVWRKDRAKQGVLAELQEAAPNFAGGFYLVPRIFE